MALGRRGRGVALALGLGLGLGGAARAEETACPGEVEALLAPPRPRGVTRAHGVLRPFFNLIGAGGGAIGDLAVDHYFELPLKVGAEISPAAVAAQPTGGGAITHLRLEAAFASDLLEAGLAVGGRTENFGPGGISLAGRLRLGALDGLNLRLTYGYAVIRNRYTDQTRVAFSNVVSTIEVPLATGLALVVDGGFSFDVWLYGTLGLKHRLVGRGGPGSWIARAGFGVAWVLDRFPCQYRNPERCEGSAWGVGPTLAFGVERRF
jgi:hypothetical protein